MKWLHYLEIIKLLTWGLPTLLCGAWISVILRLVFAFKEGQNPGEKPILHPQPSIPWRIPFWSRFTPLGWNSEFWPRALVSGDTWQIHSRPRSHLGSWAVGRKGSCIASTASRTRAGPPWHILCLLLSSWQDHLMNCSQSYNERAFWMGRVMCTSFYYASQFLPHVAW